MSSEKPILRKIVFKPKKRKLPAAEQNNLTKIYIKNANLVQTTTSPKQKTELMEHQTHKHNQQTKNANSESETETFDCVICEMKFHNHDLLLTHFRKHGRNEIDLKGRPIVNMNDINKDSSSNSTSAADQQKITKIECEWCPESFQNISKAIEHKFRKHRYESTNYFCKICGQLYPLKCALVQHMRVEHNEDESTDNSEVSKDASQNTNEKPDKISKHFQCSICKANFLSNSALKFHETAHKVEYSSLTLVPPPSKKIRITKEGIISLYYCHLCGSEYILKYNLKKHLEVYHREAERNTLPENGIIKCKACDAVFYTERAYENHNRHHCSDDLYVESEEQRRKLVTRIDQDFDISRVPHGADKVAYMKMTKELLKIQQKPPENDVDNLGSGSTVDNQEIHSNFHLEPRIVIKTENLELDD